MLFKSIYQVEGSTVGTQTYTDILVGNEVNCISMKLANMKGKKLIRKRHKQQ